MSVGCVEPGIWRLFQNAAGEYPQNSVRAREIRRNNRVRLTLAARRLLLVMAKNSVYASYTFFSKSNILFLIQFVALSSTNFTDGLSENSVATNIVLALRIKYLTVILTVFF